MAAVLLEIVLCMIVSVPLLEMPPGPKRVASGETRAVVADNAIDDRQRSEAADSAAPRSPSVAEVIRHDTIANRQRGTVANTAPTRSIGVAAPNSQACYRDGAAGHDGEDAEPRRG